MSPGNIKANPHGVGYKGWDRVGVSRWPHLIVHSEKLVGFSPLPCPSSAFLFIHIVSSLHHLGWGISILHHPGLSHEHLLVALLPFGKIALVCARHCLHGLGSPPGAGAWDIPIFQMRRMRCRKARPLVQGPMRRIKCGQPRPPRLCHLALCLAAWWHFALLFPGCPVNRPNQAISSSFIYRPMSNCPDHGTGDSKPPLLIVFSAQLVPRYICFCGCLLVYTLPTSLRIVRTP